MFFPLPASSNLWFPKWRPRFRGPKRGYDLKNLVISGDYWNCKLRSWGRQWSQNRIPLIFIDVLSRFCLSTLHFPPAELWSDCYQLLNICGMSMSEKSIPNPNQNHAHLLGVFLDSVYFFGMSFFLSKHVRKSSFFRDRRIIKESWWSLSLLGFQITLKEYLQFKGFNFLGHSAAENFPYQKSCIRGKALQQKHSDRSMEFPGSLNRWDRYHIIPQLAVYTTYIPLIYCLLGDYISPTTY